MEAWERAARQGYWEQRTGEQPRNGSPSGNGQRHAAAPTFSLDLIDSATFAGGDYRPEYLVKPIMVARQPMVVGGESKTLKTTVAMDLAVSIASGASFLGMFGVYRSVRTLILSGESGQHVLQETARRICAAKGIDFATLNVLWGFRLPQLARPEHLDVLRQALDRHKIGAVFIDPLYLCLLAGQGAGSVEASNVFQMGPLLLGVAQACLDVGCTPVLLHHTRRHTINASSYEPLELNDLAYAGLPEFARQWMLISRRKKYEPGSGLHRLWMVAGGSVGHGGCWSLDVDEGQLDDHFGGRRWDVTVTTATETRQAAGDRQEQLKADKRERTITQATTRLLVALDRIDQDRQGVSQKAARDAAGISGDLMPHLCFRLIGEGVLESVQVEARRGACGKQMVDGIRRPRSGITGTTGTHRD